MVTTRGYGVFRRIASEPVEAMVTVIAITFFLLGLYVASPFLVTESSASLSSAFGAGFSPTRAAFSLVVYILPPLPVILGLWFRKFYTPPWITVSTLGMFIATLFSILLRWITIGLLPIVWVPYVPVAGVLGVAYFFFKNQYARD